MTSGQSSVDEQVAACLGPDAVTYLANKVRGGSNGRKGARYEDFFAAFKVAEAAAACFSGVKRWPTVQEQVRAFVDDLRLASSESAGYFQLKNVLTLAWESGDRPLQVDFQYQKTLSDHLGEPSPRTTLVVSSSELCESMRDSTPASIATHTDVVHFPYSDGSLNRLVQEHEGLRALLGVLSKSEDAPLDALAAVFGVLIIGLMKQEGREASIEEVVRAARSVAPSAIRLLPKDLERVTLDSDFANLLAQLEGFRYVVDRGFFEWAYYDTSGVTSFDCLSEEFGRLQARVMARRPTTFDELEELL
ncbi:hypothetical protein [uncultured Pseudacidovorax sp.]|uniref:hypothetical protein n=1 Tax=uncultured Pseudacidovorax sp. TaxID=679313 RepID=UPI0025F1497D|nr:hypothetical protein [uncultured Pseudacidovorax sp.]